MSLNLTESNQMIFRENEIRPDHLMKGQAERCDADVKRLLHYKDHFVSVPCPACGSEKRNKVFQKKGLTYALCMDCETVYINPRPTKEILEMYYAASENYFYWNKYIFPASEKTRREKIFRPRARRIADICRSNGIQSGSLLEVGAGYGTFSEEMQRLGMFSRVIAVEPTPDLAETCRQKGLEVIEKPIEKISVKQGTMRAVVSFELIEHLFSPREFLLKCHEILSPGGLLIVTCPNVKGFDMVVLKDLSSSFGMEHLNYFHPSSLTGLLETCGFEALEVLTPGKLDAELVRNKILSNELDVSSQPFLKQLLIDGWTQVGDNFQKFLTDNLLSSHMWLVAMAKTPGRREKA